MLRMPWGAIFRKALNALASVTLLTAPVAAVAQLEPVPDAVIVEFHLAPLNKYFLTAKPAEWALLDGLASSGWRRTGMTYAAYTTAADARARPVCRYFHPGVATHFYSIDPAECALLESLRGQFVNEGIAWYAYPSVASAAAPTGKTCAPSTRPLFRAFNDGAQATNGPANHRYFGDYTFYQSYAARGYALEGLTMCLPLTQAEKRADAARLLHQATFGARPADIDDVLARGVDGWLNHQFGLPMSRYTPRDWVPNMRPDTCVNTTTPPLTSSSYCQRDNYTLFQLQREFFQHAINNPDQLRQRLAWVWSQFFVTSGVDVPQAYGMIDYQQMLREQAFGNFRTLLRNVTLHAAMGRFLDMANNQKPDATRGIAPNENYARELLQLFSIGRFLLNDDGTFRRDEHGAAIAAYTEADVEALAHVFTGWVYPTVPGQTPQPGVNPSNNMGFMEERPARHDYTEQVVLGRRIGAGLTQSQRLEAALDAVFQHSNVAPFVAKALIQQFVTGDPSPAYIARVAAVFNDNGSGVRGDIASVVRAILTDIEARGPDKWHPHYGHLSEPVLNVTRLARAMNATTDGVYFRSATAAAGQNPFYAPSVFNYYPPDHVLPTSGVIAPEFGIYNTASAIARVNAVYGVVYSTIAPDPAVYGATGTQFDLTAYTGVAADADRLLDRVDEILFAHRMTARTRDIIRAAITAVPASDALGRVRMALYLSASAPSSQVLR